jgi:inorganic pyrophosphatase
MSKTNTNNLLHSIPPGPNPPDEVYCLVEIPRGTSNKYEYDKKLSVFRLDRVLYGAMFYPTEYGFIPQTLSIEDKDPLDIMVVSTYPTFPGCLLSTRPIGMVKMTDSGEEDNKIIAVPTDDPRFTSTKEIDDLGPHFKKETQNFWENYAALQPNKEIVVNGWGSADEAKKMIQKAIEDYKGEFKNGQ